MTDTSKPDEAKPDEAPASASAKPRGKAKATTYTVARGRTLYFDGEDRGPGTEVELDEAEAKRLIAAGFLNNPDADTPVILTGPKIQKTEE